MELLTHLYYISSPSRHTTEMVKFLVEFAETNVPTASINVSNGNVYITKGSAPTYPCVVAHTDEVHRTDPNKVIYTLDDENHIFGYSTVEGKTTGIGADDKNGIWVALKMLLKHDTIKVAFFCDEEVGCIGSSNANMQFFKDCRFVIQCDRRGSSDFIYEAGGTTLCSQDFIEALPLTKYGYKKTIGLSTDVMQLKRKGLSVSCCNFSCGYYNPHTANECTHFNELTNCLNFVDEIISTTTEVFKHTYIAPTVKYATYRSSAITDDEYAAMYETWMKNRENEKQNTKRHTKSNH